MIGTKYYRTLVEEKGELILPIPEEIISYLNIDENSLLDFIVQEDGTILITVIEHE